MKVASVSPPRPTSAPLTPAPGPAEGIAPPGLPPSPSSPTSTLRGLPPAPGLSEGGWGVEIVWVGLGSAKLSPTQTVSSWYSSSDIYAPNNNTRTGLLRTS
eukprot:1006280-Prorocentrum_minimum.AAC.2